MELGEVLRIEFPLLFTVSYGNLIPWLSVAVFEIAVDFDAVSAGPLDIVPDV